MSHSQFHCTGRVYLDLHGLIFETSICYWQDQPGSPLSPRGDTERRRLGRGGPGRAGPAGPRAGAGPVRPSVRPSARRGTRAPWGGFRFFFAGALPPFPGRGGPGRGSGRGNTVGVRRTGSRVRETPCSPEAPTRGRVARWGGLPSGWTTAPPRGTPRRGSVVGRLGQTGRLGLAACGSARPGRGRLGSQPPRTGKPNRDGPGRRTRGPEEPSARTPALGRPAGALRWRVTCANRSGRLEARFRSGNRGPGRG